jgi:hypothetical protein
MDTQALTRTARTCIAGFDSTAHRAIAAWRDGSERLGGFARARWDTAFEESKPQLSPETQRNASHARDVFARYYGQGVTLAADGAEATVQALVHAAEAAVDRADAWQQARA